MAPDAVSEGQTGTLGGGAPQPRFPHLSRGRNASPYFTGKLQGFDDTPRGKCAEGCGARQGWSHSRTPRLSAVPSTAPWQQVATPRLRSQAWGFTGLDTAMGAVWRSEGLWVEPPSERGAPGWRL